IGEALAKRLDTICLFQLSDTVSLGQNKPAASRRRGFGKGYTAILKRDWNRIVQKKSPVENLKNAGVRILNESEKTKLLRQLVYGDVRNFA
ncbi:MAG: hypothetical protein ACLRVT_04995, partial [Oscillospiraceae bacterium]